jgi:chromosome segregation ATPase
MSIAKQKYEKSKRRISDLQKLLDRCEVDNTEKTLELLNKEQEFTELENANAQLQAEVTRWKSLSERLPDESEIEELSRTNKKQSKLIDNLEKQITKLENNREMLLFQIKTLEESRNDLKTQLVELKQEYREFKKG